MKRASRLLSSAALIPLAVLASPAVAQQAAPATASAATETAAYDFEIVVTGQKISRTLQDTQASVAVLTAEAIEQSTIQELTDTFVRVANVNATSAEGGFGYSIRGISSRGLTNDGRTTSSVYVDGAVMQLLEGFADGVNPLSLWDISQIEIFRGPQSTIQGRNSLSGAIVIRTADPTWDWEAKGRALIAEYDTRQFAAAVSGPLVEDQVAMRFAINKRDSDGTLTNSHFDINDADFKDDFNGRAKLLVQPAGLENFRALLTYNYFDTRSGDQELVTASGDDSFDPFDRTTAKGYSAIWESETHQGILEMSLDLSDALSLTSVSAYNEVTSERSDRPGTLLGFDPFLQYTEALQAEGTGFTQELRATYDRGPIRALAGVYYADVDLEYSREIDLGIFGFGDGVATDVKNQAIFGHLEYDLGQLTLIAGARYDHEDSTTTVLGATPTEATYSAFLPKGGLVYNFTDDVSLGFTVQKAYRAGGSGSSFLGFDYEFDPEYTWNYELAFRSALFDKQVYFNANAFYVDWSGQQVQVQGPIIPEFGIPDTFIDNVGESRLYGFEAEISGRVAPGLEVFVSAGMVKTEFQSPAEFDGEEFPFAPEFQGAAGLTYTAESGAFVQADISRTGSFYTRTTNTPDFFAEGRTIVNAKIGYQSDNWGIYAFAKNLFDEDYLLDVQRNDATFGSTYRVGDPQVLGVELNLKY